MFLIVVDGVTSQTVTFLVKFYGAIGNIWKSDREYTFHI